MKVYNIANSQCIYYKVAIQRNLQAAAAEKVAPSVKTAEANVDTNAEKEAGKADCSATIPDQVVDAEVLQVPAINR